MVHSSTDLLPAWKKILAELKLKIRKMPRDVATRWNSTYLMLAFAVEYKEAINQMTLSRDKKLADCALNDEEWVLVQQLCDILKVSS